MLVAESTTGNEDKCKGVESSGMVVRLERGVEVARLYVRVHPRKEDTYLSNYTRCPVHFAGLLSIVLS